MTSAERRRHGVIEPRNPALPAPRRSFAWGRALGAAGMLVLTAVLWWLLTDDSFRVDEDAVEVTGVRYTDEARVADALGELGRSPNVFRVRPADLAAALMTLPEVRDVQVRVLLPARVEIGIIERVPIFVWSNGGDAWLVDREGVLFARPGPVEPSGSDPAPTGLPSVEDARIVAQPPGPGDRLGQVDLAVMRQLLALDPEMIGSVSTSLRLRVDERDGYVLESLDLGWQALFGRYSPTLHPPELIPRQVQCLAALLRDREDRVSRVWLAPAGLGCGTHLPIVAAG